MPAVRSRSRQYLLALAALLYVAAGVLHFVVPRAYLRAMPGWVPYPLEMIYLTGIAEIAGGLGLTLPRFRRQATWGLVVLLVLVFPANVKMALDSPNLLFWARLPVQGLLIWWLLWCTEPAA